MSTYQGINYGSGKTKNFSTSNWSELPDRQEYLDQKSIKLPPNQITVNQEVMSQLSISGDNWANKYDRSRDPAFIAARS